MIKEYIIKIDEDHDKKDIYGGYPLIDTPLELIRCKDCKYWYFADNRIPCERENVCGRNGIVVTPDWYCADGDRKEGQ